MPLSPRDRRALIILGAVGAVIIVFVLFTVLTGGGGEEQALPTPPPVSQTGAPSPTVTPTPTPRETLPPVVLVGGRDPFSPPPELAPTPSGGVSPSPSASPTVSPSPGGSPTATPTAPSGGASTSIGGHTVVLLDIFTRNGQQMAQVQVDSNVFTVGVGEQFDDNFRLVSISGNCGRFTFGDQGFTLCVTPQK